MLKLVSWPLIKDKNLFLYSKKYILEDEANLVGSLLLFGEPLC